MNSKVTTADSDDGVIWVAFLMCLLGAIFYCYEYYLRVAPSVMQSELQQAYHVSQSGLGAMVAYYYLAYVPLQIPVGIMMDRIGPRRILTFACLACAVGTYFFAGTNMSWVAKLGRFLVGFGSAFAYVGVLKIADIWLPKRYFAMMAGLTTALGMFGAISGEILMAKFVNLTGWRQALYSSAFMGFVLAFILWAFIRDQSDREFMTRGRASHGGKSLSIELLEVVKNKQLWINGIIGCLMFLPLTAFAEFWAVSYLETAGLNKEYAALGSAMVFFGFGLGGPIWGRMSDFIESRRRPLMLGAILSAFAAGIILYANISIIFILFAMLIIYGFCASAQILVFAVANDQSSPGMGATAVSFTNFLVMLGGFALQPMVGVILDIFQEVSSDGSIVISVEHFKIALTIMPVGLTLAAVCCFFLKESYNYKQ